MLRPRWKKVLRDVWLHKSRTMLVVLAISVGSIGAGSVLDAWAIVRTATRVGFDASNPASARLRTDSISATLLAVVRRVPGIANAQARRVITARAITDDGSRTAILFVMDDFRDASIGTIDGDEGVWPPGNDEFVIERSSVDFAGKRVGDSIRLAIGDALPIDLPVQGIARDVGLAPGWMEHVIYGFVTPATLKRLGATSSLNELQITVKDRSLERDAVRRIAYEVKAAVERTGHAVTNVDVPVPGEHIHAAQMNSLLLTQGAFGVLALILSAFLVVNLITAMLTGQVREIGTMKAMGARTGQVAAMYLVLASVLGLVALAIAIPAAALIGRAYARFNGDLLNFSVDGVAIPNGALLVQLAVGMLLPVVAAAIPVWRGCRVSVSEALRDFGITTGGSTTRSGFIRAASGLSRPLLISLSNAFRRRQRMALTLLTLSTGGAVYLGALNLRTSVRGAVDLLFDMQNYDLSLRFVRPWPVDSLEGALGRIGGVAGAEAWGATQAAISLGDGTLGNAFTLSALPADTKMFVPTLEQGRWLRRDDADALVVSRVLAKDEPRFAVGGNVVVVTGGRARMWKVVGVADAGTAPAAFTTREAFARATGSAQLDRVVLAAAPGNDSPAALLKLVAAIRTDLASQGLHVQSSQLVEAGQGAVEDHLLMVASFLGVMSTLMIIVGGLGLAATMSLGVMERTREIGVLRAIGAKHGTIQLMIHVEGLVVALLSWALAIPLSLPMSVILGKAFGRVMIPVPTTLVPDVSGVLQWLGLVVGVSLVACAWPATRAMRIPTAAALAYE